MIHNERIKLLASLLNGIVSSAIVAGVEMQPGDTLIIPQSWF